MNTIANFRHFRNYDLMSTACAEQIINRIQQADKMIIGIATGSSPKMLYTLIGDQLNEIPALREKIEILQLDEWHGLSKKNPSSCHYSIVKDVINPWQLNSNQCHMLEGDKKQVKQMINMHQRLEQRPLDLCVLGFGKNGHLAFNEPGSMGYSTCRIVKLDKASRNHAMVSEAGRDISKGMTIGLYEIMLSKEIILLITGKGKKEAYMKFKKSKKVSRAPASVLYRHKNWTSYVDDFTMK